MPSLLVKDISAELLREINYAAAKAGQTQRGWVIEILEGAANGDGVRISSKADMPTLSGVDVGEAPTGRALGTSADTQRNTGRVDGGVQADTGGERKVKSSGKGKLSPEQFFGLSNSDRMRATREGRYP